MSTVLSTPCLISPYKSDARGYGRCNLRRFGKRVSRAHVLAWIDANGRLPAPGMQINHHCDNPPCWRADHLYEGSQSENMLDSYRRGRIPEQLNRTHCPQGHEYDEENTRHNTDGSRGCRACHRHWSKLQVRLKAAQEGRELRVVRPWSVEEKELLRTDSPHKELAAQLGRTVSSVKHARQRLELKEISS